MPGADTPVFSIVVESYRELADLAAEHNVTIVVENHGWIEADPKIIPLLINALDGRIAASPDLANWTPEVRYEGLKRCFPHAVTCDFRTRGLTAAWEHRAYDLRRCFDIGWQAGFRGPWCLENMNSEAAANFRQLRWLKSQLEAWIREAGA